MTLNIHSLESQPADPIPAGFSIIVDDPSGNQLTDNLGNELIAQD